MLHKLKSNVFLQERKKQKQIIFMKKLPSSWLSKIYIHEIISKSKP